MRRALFLVLMAIIVGPGRLSAATPARSLLDPDQKNPMDDIRHPQHPPRRGHHLQEVEPDNPTSKRSIRPPVRKRAKVDRSADGDETPPRSLRH